MTTRDPKGEARAGFVEAHLTRVAEALAGGVAGDELHRAAERIARAVGAETVAIIGVAAGADALTLLAASDDPDVGRLTLPLARYPEVRRALETAEPVFIGDVGRSEILGAERERVARRGIGALLAFPILVAGRATGVLLVRFAENRAELPPDHFGFGRLAAAAVAVALRAGPSEERGREVTRRVSLRDMSEQMLLRALERHRDFIDSATDGMFVLAADGRVLYMNNAAAAITGYALDGLVGRPVETLVATSARADFSRRVAAAARGEAVPGFDVDLLTTSHDTVTVSVTSIGILAEHEAAIFAFRDVTEARALDRELRSTKEYLERILAQSVDAIVASDRDGTIRVFNRGAERVYGRRAEDVVGKLNVRELYFPGDAEELMRLLRNPEHGGVGRLQKIRRDVPGPGGERVPVELSAAIVRADDGSEVATVGIFSDLRDRLHMEQRLAEAQEKLAISEKQVGAMELAGAAAHELNQPLTSVMGYAELLRKKLGPDSPHLRAVDTILQEAERLAAIVRKLGTVTRYETKSYVGAAQIVDLDRSSGGDTTR